MAVSTEISLLFAFVLSRTVIATTEVICDSSYPTLNSSVLCTCINKNKNDITWYTNNKTLTDCIQAFNTCIPATTEYDFSMTSNSSGSYFFATINSYDYTYCSSYSCQDVNLPDDISSEQLWITDFDLSQEVSLTEPALHESGNITITTQCLFIPNTKDLNDIITIWYKIENTTTSRYDKANEEISRTFNQSDCQSCNGNSSIQLIVSHMHKDENTSYQEVQIMLHIYDITNPSNGIFKTTSNKYRVKGGKEEVLSNDGASKIIIIVILAVAGFLVVSGGIAGCVIAIILSRKQAPNTDFRWTERTERSITVVWKTDSARVRWNRFRVSWHLNGQVKKSKSLKNTGEENMQYTIDGLIGRRMYYLSLEAQHWVKTKDSKHIQAETLGKPDPPSDFTLDETGLTKSSIPVKWTPGYDGGYSQQFSIQYSLGGSKKELTYKGDTTKCTIENLTERTQYNLSISAINRVGISSSSVTLKVETKGKPDPPKKFSISEHGTTESSITLQWEPGFDGGYPQQFVLSFSYNSNVCTKSIDCSNEKIMKYDIKELAERTLYTFGIYATNQEGRSTPVKPLTLQTKNKPQPPTQFSLIEDGVTESSIAVQWNAGYDGGYPQQFTLTYSAKGQKCISKCIDGEGKKHLDYIIKNVTEKTTYTLKLFAQNKVGKSLTAKAVNVQTKGKPDPPEQLSLVTDGVTESRIVVKWKPGYDGGYKQHFILRYSQEGYDPISTNIDSTDVDFIEHKIENLTERTHYILEIFAKNKAGKSSPVKPLEVETKGKPDPPEQLSLVTDGVTESSIVVKWKPGYDGGYKQHFILMYSQKGHDPISKDIESTGADFIEHKIEDLPERTHYILKIFAKNQAGKSPSVKPLEVETEGNPDVRRVKDGDVKKTSIKLPEVATQ